MKKLLALLALALGGVAFAADQLPLFNATLSTGKETLFVLIDGAGKSSNFLALGESFAGYKLKSYDPKTGVLEVEKDGKLSKLTLKTDAAIAHAAMPAAKATLADAEAVLNKMHFEEMIARGMERQKKMLASQFERMGQQMASQGVNAADAAAFQKKITDEVFGILDPQTLKGDVSKIYSEVFTKQELDQMAAFYSTPLGEMINAKQPEVQDKLGAIIQTRMMDVMPRVQQMSREFMREQRARQGGGAPSPATPPPAPAPKQ